MEKKKEEKRKKFHDALLSLYHPPPPPPPPQPPPSFKEFDEELLTLVNGDVNFNLDPVSDDEAQEENSASDAKDCDRRRLTRAQRKRIRKRKLKETAAFVRRKVIGPLFPSDYDDSKEEDCTDNNMKPDQENKPNRIHDTT